MLKQLNGNFTVRFLLSNNQPGSMTRITADTASTFARKGIRTVILFPAVDWWDYRLFALRWLKGRRRWKTLLKMAVDFSVGLFFRRKWCGFKYYAVDSHVGTTRYFLRPSASTWKENEMTVVHPPYLIPHLLRTLDHLNVPIVSALHMNLEKALKNPDPMTAAWYEHWVARERLVSVPRYTTSRTAKEAAERLGIPVRRIIHDGSLDLDLFHPARGPAERNGAPVVTLYCDTHPQKGQAVGAQAFRMLKGRHPNVRLCSIGKVIPEFASLFDHSYGFLHGTELVKAIQASDIFVYPSLYDGFPAPPLQAMACGAALVTTAVEGVNEYAVHEENALLCLPGDAEAIKNQVLRLIQDRELLRKLKTHGPETAQRYSVEQSAQQLLDFLREVHREMPFRLNNGVVV